MTVHRKSEYRLDRGSFMYELIDVGGARQHATRSRAVIEVLGEPVDDSPLERAALPLIITGFDPGQLTQELLDQRGDPDTALRPIAVAGIQNYSDAPTVEQLADAVLPSEPDGSQLMEASKRLLDLALRVQELPCSRDDASLRLLQFLESRRLSLEPRLDPASRTAYRYPLAEAVLGTGASRAVDVLTDMAQHGVFQRSTVDRVHVCPDCHGYRIPVKEVCPECQSPDVSLEVSIHHFRCGYMAPESRFTGKDGYLSCPKCNKYLRHIGVEYNRPSEVCVCGSCGYWAQRPELKAWCVDCNSLFSPEEVKTVRIHRYGLTADARGVARAGSWIPGQRAAPATAARAVKPERPPARGADSISREDGDVHRARDVLRALIGVAQPTQWPIALFEVRLRRRGDDASEPSLEAVESALKVQLSEHDIIGPVASDTLLLAVPESDSKRAPSIGEMRRWAMRQDAASSAQVEISRIDAAEALRLLGTG